MDEPESPTPRKSNATHPAVWMTISIVGGLAILAYMLSGGMEGSASDNSRSNSDRVEVIYNVTDTRNGNVSLTYQNSSGNSQQDAAEATPWKKRYRMESGSFMYVSAQRGHNSGSVTCTITVDGKVVERAKSTGAAVIATCSGRVP